MEISELHEWIRPGESQYTAARVFEMSMHALPRILVNFVEVMLDYDRGLERKDSNIAGTPQEIPTELALEKGLEGGFFMAFNPWQINDISISELSNTNSIAESIISESGSDTIEYDFDGPKCKVRRTFDMQHIRDYAPHELTIQNKLLRASSAKESTVRTDKRTKAIYHSEGAKFPLLSLFPALQRPPQEAFNSDGCLRRKCLAAERPELFDASGFLQKFVVAKGKPAVFSATFYSWLAGNACVQHSFPTNGPTKEALEVIVLTYLNMKPYVDSQGRFPGHACRSSLGISRCNGGQAASQSIIFPWYTRSEKKPFSMEYL